MELGPLDELLDVWVELDRPILELRWEGQGKSNWKQRESFLHKGIVAVYFLLSPVEGDLFSGLSKTAFYVDVGGMTLPLGFSSLKDAQRYEVAWLGQGPPLGKMVWEGDRVVVSIWEDKWSILYAGD